MTTTIDQLVTDLGLTLNRDPDGTVNSLKPPNPIPPVGTPYCVIQPTGDNMRIQTQGTAQDRERLVLVSVYGLPDTAAGQWQLDLILAHLRARSGEITAHRGIRLRECLPADLSPVMRDPATTTVYGATRYALAYTAG